MEIREYRWVNVDIFLVPCFFFLFLLWRWGWGGGCCYRFLYLYVCMYIILQDDTSLEKQISGLLHLSVERVLLLRSNPSCCISCRWVRFLYITVCEISVCSVCTCKFSQGGREVHGEKKAWMWPWVLNWDSSTAWMGRLLSRVWVFLRAFAMRRCDEGFSWVLKCVLVDFWKFLRLVLIEWLICW